MAATIRTSRGSSGTSVMRQTLSYLLASWQGQGSGVLAVFQCNRDWKAKQPLGAGRLMGEGAGEQQGRCWTA